MAHVQGGSFAYLTPTLAITAAVKASQDWNDAADGTNHERFLVTMREVQGGIITSALFIMAFAMSGLLRAVLHYISPLTVAVNIGIVGLSLYSSGFRSGFRASDPHIDFILQSAKVALQRLLQAMLHHISLLTAASPIAIPSHVLYSTEFIYSRDDSSAMQLLLLALSVQSMPKKINLADAPRKDLVA